MAGAGASPNLSVSKKTAPFPATAGSGKTRSTTKWYEEIDYYDEEEIEEFNRETSTAKNSRHSLETDEEESDESEHEHMRLEAAEATGRTEADGIMAKLFRPRSPPEPPKQHTVWLWSEGIQANLDLENSNFPFLIWELFYLRKIYVCTESKNRTSEKNALCRWICQ